MTIPVTPPPSTHYRPFFRVLNVFKASEISDSGFGKQRYNNFFIKSLNIDLIHTLNFISKITYLYHDYCVQANLSLG